MTPRPTVGIWSLGANAPNYRALPQEIIDHGYLYIARTKIAPMLARTGVRRLLWAKAAGVAATDEPSHNDSFRGYSILAAENPALARTIEPALKYLDPLVDEHLIYIGDPCNSIGSLQRGTLASTFDKINNCLGPFTAHPKCSLVMGASAMHEQGELSEHLFQFIKAWRRNGTGSGVRVYREGHQVPGRTFQYGDPCYCTYESFTTSELPPMDQLTDEFIVQQPNVPIPTLDFIAQMRALGFTPAVSLADLAGAVGG